MNSNILQILVTIIAVLASWVLNALVFTTIISFIFPEKSTLMDFLCFAEGFAFGIWSLNIPKFVNQFFE